MAFTKKRATARVNTRKKNKNKNNKITYKGGSGTRKSKGKFLSKMVESMPTPSWFRSKPKTEAVPNAIYNPMTTMTNENYEFKENETEDEFNARIGSYIQKIKETENHDIEEIKQMVEIMYVIMQKIKERKSGFVLPDKKVMDDEYLLLHKDDIVIKIRNAVTEYDKKDKNDEAVFNLLKTVYTLCTN